MQQIQVAQESFQSLPGWVHGNALDSVHFEFGQVLTNKILREILNVLKGGQGPFLSLYFSMERTTERQVKIQIRLYL